MQITARIVAAGVATAVLAGVGVGFAYADPTASPTTSPTASATTAPSASPTAGPAKPGRQNGKHARGLLARGLHGEVTVGAKKPRVVVFQRGTVTAVDGKTVTVKSQDEFTATYELSADTKVRRQREAAQLSDVKPGVKVRIVGTREVDKRTAKRIALAKS